MDFRRSCIEQVFATTHLGPWLPVSSTVVPPSAVKDVQYLTVYSLGREKTQRKTRKRPAFYWVEQIAESCGDSTLSTHTGPSLPLLSVSLAYCNDQPVLEPLSPVRWLRLSSSPGSLLSALLLVIDT